MSFLLFSFSLTSFFLVRPDISWHNQQRLAQLIVLVFSLFLLPFFSQYRLPKYAFYMLFGVACLGVLSCFVSASYIFWGLLEWSRYLGLVGLSFLCSQIANSTKKKLFFVVMVSGIAAIHSFHFVLYYLMAFATGVKDFGFDVLTTGFSNRRFFSQFQVMAMPWLAYLAVISVRKERWIQFGLINAVLSIQWCIALAAGGRGFWLAMVCSHILLLMFSVRYIYIVKMQAVSLVIGAALFFIFFIWIPDLMAFPLVVHDTLRLGSSGRTQLWNQAWEMTLHNPWLGVGPMHFSEIINGIGAHPHQFFLQWSSEWGVPAVLMVGGLTLWGGYTGVKALREKEYDFFHAALWLSICSAFVLAQVDGVFVMPYTEVWLSVLIGLALASWGQSGAIDSKCKPLMMLMFLLSMLIMSAVLYLEIPILVQSPDIPLGDHHVGWRPRFWVDGWLE